MCKKRVQTFQNIKKPLEIKRFFIVEERMGFEPTDAVNVTAFPMLRLRPLGHLSETDLYIIHQN